MLCKTQSWGMTHALIIFDTSGHITKTVIVQSCFAFCPLSKFTHLPLAQQWFLPLLNWNRNLKPFLIKSLSLKEKFAFLHIKSYDKDIHDHIWCYRRSCRSWRSLLTLMWDENNRGARAPRQSVYNIIYARFKRRETRRMFSGVLSCTDTKTLS